MTSIPVRTRRRGPVAASIAYDVLPYSIIAGANVVKAASGNTAISNPGDAAYSVQVDHDGGAADDVILDLGAAFDMRPYVSDAGQCVVLCEIQRPADTITPSDEAQAYFGLWDGSQSTCPIAGLSRKMSGSAGVLFGQVRNTSTGAFSVNNNTNLINEPTAARFNLSFGADGSREQQASAMQIGAQTSNTTARVLTPDAPTLDVAQDWPLSNNAVVTQRAYLAARTPAGPPQGFLRLYANGGTARTWMVTFALVPVELFRSTPYA